MIGKNVKIILENGNRVSGILYTIDIKSYTIVISKYV